MIKQGKTDKDFVFDIFNYIILGICALTVIYPLYFIAIASVSSPEMVTTGMVILLPREITYEGYYKLLNNSQVWIGYRNTFFYTVMGTLLNVVLTLTAAFALAKKDLGGKGVIMGFLVFTMLFHGGIIPRYLVVKQVGIINTVWALILPNAVSVWNIIIARTFFQSTIPDELGEAAYIDGCSNTKYFWNIVLPLSPALIAVLVLFYGVNHWNAL